MSTSIQVKNAFYDTYGSGTYILDAGDYFFNTIGPLLGMGVMQLLIPTVRNMYNVYDEAGNLLISGYARPELYRIIAPVGIIVSVLLTILAIIGIVIHFPCHGRSLLPVEKSA